MGDIKALVTCLLLIINLCEGEPGSPILTNTRGRSRIARSTNAKTTIQDIIPGDYNNRETPNVSNSTVVEVSMVIMSMHAIDAKDMSYSMSLYLRQGWTDPRLAYSTAEGTGYAHALRIHPDDMDMIWQPDLFFANERDSRWHDVTVPNKIMRIQPDGSVLYDMKLTVTLACHMDLERFPFDTQLCPMDLESYGYTLSDVTFKWNDRPTHVNNKVRLPQFTLKNKTRYDTFERLTTGTYQRLSLNFSLKRNVGYFAVRMFFPSVLLVALSWLAFWLGRDALTARVLVGLLVMTSLTMVSNSGNDVIPAVSYTKAIDIWFTVCFLFVFAVLVEVATVEFLRQRRQPADSGNEKDGDNRVSETGSKVDVVCKAVFPVVFSVFLLVYFAIYASADE